MIRTSEIRQARLNIQTAEQRLLEAPQDENARARLHKALDVYHELAERYEDQSEAIATRAHDIYAAGTWICSEQTVEEQVRLWTEMRDALGIEPGAMVQKLGGNPIEDLRRVFEQVTSLLSDHGPVILHSDEGAWAASKLQRAVAGYLINSCQDDSLLFETANQLSEAITEHLKNDALPTSAYEQLMEKSFRLQKAVAVHSKPSAPSRSRKGP